MKKIVSLCVAVCLCVTMLFSAVTSVSAEIVQKDFNVDFTKTVEIGENEVNLTMTVTKSSECLDVDIRRYTREFMEGNSPLDGDKLWIGRLVALYSTDGEILAFANGAKYSVNIIYDVVEKNGADVQIGFGYNYDNEHPTGNNGTKVVAAKKHTTTGNDFTLSAVLDGQNGKFFRLFFGGHGKIKVKNVSVREMKDTEYADFTKNQNFINADNSKTSIGLNDKNLILNIDYADKGRFLENTTGATTFEKRTWLPSYYFKNSDNQYITLTVGKQYELSVTYKVTDVVPDTDYGVQIGFGAFYQTNNQTLNKTYKKHTTSDIGKEFTLKYTSTAEKINNSTVHYPKLIFAGKGTIEVYSVTVSEIPDGTVNITYNNSGIEKTDLMLKNASLDIPTKSGYKFSGWFTADGIRVEKATGNMTVTAAWIKEGNIDLSKSEKINGDKANMTITAPTSESGNLKVDISGYKKLIFNGDTVKAPIWAGGALVSLNYADGSFAGLKSASKYVINVDYDVTNVRTGNALFYPQIAVVYNNNTSDSNTLKDNGSYALAVKKHSKIGSYSLSCVVSGKDSNALRLLFDGEGVFSVKSVSVSEFSSDVTGISAVKYAGGIYNSENAVFAVNGSVLPTLPQNPAANFGGWYNGDTKVVTVSGDAELTAKWYDKTDLNMDNKTDVIDLIKIKKALASSSDDLFFDVLRNGKVGAGDITAVKKYLLGNEVISVNGEDLSSYKVRQGNMQSFMTSEAIASLIGSVEDAFEITLPMTADDEVNENEIVVGLTGSSADNAAAETATGINGDTYKADEYKIFFVGNKLYVEAGSDYATAYAVNKLIDYLTLYRTIPTGFTLSGEYGGDYSLLDGYAYVWGDEFDGATLNKSLWTVETGEQAGTYYTRNNSYYSGSVASLRDSDSTNDYGGPWIDVEDSPQMQDGTIMLLDDEGNNYGLNNGLLTMKTAKTATGYSATKISANVRFKFGIMTARVKIGTKNGACTTLWSRTVDNGGASVNEMDFVENYGKDQILPNLHTWKNYTESVNHGALNEIALRNTVTPADGESLSDSFHDIALKWTDKKITFYFDGKVYLEQDIAADAEKWEAFQKSTYLIMGISAPKADYCNYGGSKPGDILGSMINTFAESTSVDYIRIFQNKNGTLTNK